MEDFVMDSNDKLYGILAYLGLLVLVPTFAGKTEFARYHANQGWVLFICELILGVAVGIVGGIITVIIPFVGGIILGVLEGIIGLVSLIMMILGIVNVANGEMKPLPVIGGIKILK